MIVERVARIARGCILYDASRVRKAVETLFDPQWWLEHGSIEKVTGGRASISLLKHEDQCWVLRHYRRGGFAARISADTYLWTGQSRVRSFAEWRLLARLRALNLPVPAPIAARYERGALGYQADLITEFLPHTQTLAAAISSAAREPVWRAVGSTIASFHVEGVHHADLNANNVLLKLGTDASELEGVYLLDFDRGRIRSRGSWESIVLGRLRRSLQKISAQLGAVFDERQWQWLMEGYRERAGGRLMGSDSSPDSRR